MSKLTPQQKYSQSLRNLAAWYDEHPNAPVNPSFGTFDHVFSASPEEIRSIGTGDKEYSGELFYYHVKGDGFHIRFFTLRSTVCERKVVGYQEVPEQVIAATPELVIPAQTVPIYEYDCKPLLGTEVTR